VLSLAGSLSLRAPSREPLATSTSPFWQKVTPRQNKVFDLQNRGYSVGMLLEQEKTGRLATVRLTRASERSVYVDLLFASRA
jgi:hypothetical protein